VSKSFYPEFLKKIKTLDENSSTKKKSASKKKSIVIKRIEDRKKGQR
jgi:hypothetical protein